MDINKLNAPLHIRCPKCKAELEYNPRRVKDRLENMKTTAASIQSQLPQIKDKRERKKKMKELDGIKWYMKLLKEDNNMISTLLKEETDRIMRGKIREMIGDETWIRLHQEAEEQAIEENVFHTYELAIQKYSNIMDFCQKEDGKEESNDKV